MGSLLCLLASTLAAPAVTHTGACAHRGDNRHAPENTIPAFVSAVQKGAHQIEFDLQFSKDGQLAVMHDPTVDRTTNGKGPVSSLTWAELRALDAGSWFDAKFAGTRIPSFREVLEVIPPGILCNVHLKEDPTLGAAAAKVIADMNRLDQCFLAATADQAASAKTVSPTLRICNMTREGLDRTAYADKTIQLGTAFIQVFGPVRGLKETVDTLHQHGVKVNYFSAQTEAAIRQLAEAGVDYILTDDLDVCLKTLADYGAPPVQPEAP